MMPTFSSSARRRDDRALVVELLLEDDDLALDLVARRLHDVEPFVEDQLLAGLDRLHLDRAGAG